MKRIKLISVIIAAAVTAVISFSGCIGTISEEAEAENEDEKKKSAFSYTDFADKFLNLYQQADEKVAEYIEKSEDEEDILYEGLNPLIAKQMRYQINADEEREKEGKVLVTIENIDFAKIFQNVMKEKWDGESAEEILSQLEEQIQAKNAPKKKYECTIEIVSDGDNYYIQLNKELIEALSGGYNEY